MLNSSLASTLTPSEVVDEYLDCEKRKNNLIVYNLEETNAAQTATERSKSDMNVLAQLLHSELHVDDVEITKCIRLGKATQNKPRPVLITVLDANKRSSILRNKRTPQERLHFMGYELQRKGNS